MQIVYMSFLIYRGEETLMIFFLQGIVSLCMFMIGTLFGSFFSLALYRIPRHEDIVFKNSYCPQCKHKLAFFDLIPILSYLFRKGKCKYCGKKIPISYLLLELINGAVFLICYQLLGYQIELFIVLLVYVILFLIVGILLQKRRSYQSPKKGVFVTELVVAFLLFTILLSSMYVIVRNQIHKSILTIARGNALSIAIATTEEALAIDYENLQSFTTTKVEENVEYTSVVTVTKYSDEDTSKEDIVKKIETKVTYLIDQKEYELEIRTVKGKGMQ